MGDDRPPVYYEDDVLIIRASAIGTSCLWELVAAGQGYDPGPVPENLQRAFDDGNRLEPVIIGMLEKDIGQTVYGAQDEGHLDISIDPPIRIRFHPDGRLTDKGIEVKALGDVLWQKAARHSVGDCIHEYKWQLSIMMHAYDMPFMWVAYNKGHADKTKPCPDEGRLLYETVLLPPISLDEIRDKALKIKELVDGDDIMVSGRECDDPTHFPCRFLHLRPEPNQGWLTNMADEDGLIDATLKLSGEEAEELDRLVRVYRTSKGVAEEAKEAADKARDRIIELASKYKRVMTDKYVVPVMKGSQSSPDWASMPENIREEAKKYKKTTTYYYVKNIQALGEE